MVKSFLDANPGASTRMVARGLGVDDSTADYHLRRLRKEGHLAVDANGRETAWWTMTCGFCPVLRRAIPAFRREGVAATALALDDWPITALVLAERTGLAPATVRGHLEVLEEAGIAVRTTRGRAARAEGAQPCIAMAQAGRRCERWGTCPVSKRMARRGGAAASE
jgi:predicted ArsR family transcriptional regulator